MTDFRARLDGTESCGLCGKPRTAHWGRRNALAPQKLGHQWRPAGPHKYAAEHAADEMAAEAGYEYMLKHPESVSDASDAF
jgi:hypothetical protein